jgi:hypothetical protein
MGNYKGSAEGDQTPIAKRIRFSVPAEVTFRNGRLGVQEFSERRIVEVTLLVNSGNYQDDPPKLLSVVVQKPDLAEFRFVEEGPNQPDGFDPGSVCCQSGYCTHGRNDNPMRACCVVVDRCTGSSRFMCENCLEDFRQSPVRLLLPNPETRRM